MTKVKFNYADVSSIALPAKRTIMKFVEHLFEKEGRHLSTLNYIFCTDTFLLKVNQDFLNHDEYTDIVTFDLSETDNTIGEVYISVDRVAENAPMHHTTFNNEMLRVIFHGALHLCGYRDKKKSEIIEMRAKEDYYLHLFHSNQMPS